jgi:hypothetical protein
MFFCYGSIIHEIKRRLIEGAGGSSQPIIDCKPDSRSESNQADNLLKYSDISL